MEIVLSGEEGETRATDDNLSILDLLQIISSFPVREARCLSV